MDVLVAGATGRLGGPLAHHLIERGHQVRALTRAPASPVAARLRGRGARVVAGDLDDPRSLRQAVAGTDAVFVLSTPHHGAGAAAEVRQAVALAEAAAEAGAGYLVYASAAGAGEVTGVPMLDAKRQVEAHLRALSVPHAVVAPVFFMENLAYPWNRAVLRAGLWPIPLPPTRTVQLVSAGDVARFAALVIERRADFAGRRVEVAADQVTGPQAAAILSRALGHPIAHTEAVPEPLAAMAPFFRWIAATGFHAGVRQLRTGYPEIGWRTLQQWAATQDWSDLFEPRLADGRR